MNVTTPKPRNAKKVRATLEMMSWRAGYPEKARRWGLRLARVEIEKTVRMPMTTKTTTVCARATALEPKTLRNAMATMSKIANADTAPLPSADTALLA